MGMPSFMAGPGHDHSAGRVVPVQPAQRFAYFPDSPRYSLPLEECAGDVAATRALVGREAGQVPFLLCGHLAPLAFVLLLHRLVDRIAYCREIVTKVFSHSLCKGTLPDLVRHIPNSTITALPVEPGSSLAGTTLGAITLRKRYHLFVLAIRRGDEAITGMSGEIRIEAGDNALIYATPEDIAKGARLFNGVKND